MLSLKPQLAVASFSANRASYRLDAEANVRTHNAHNLT